MRRYCELLRALFADQMARGLEDRAHLRVITERNGRDSLAMAVAATRSGRRRWRGWLLLSPRPVDTSVITRACALFPMPNARLSIRESSPSIALSPEHPVGGHKAILFERIIGITAEHAKCCERFFRTSSRSRFGRCWSPRRVRPALHDRLYAPDGGWGLQAIRSAWIVRRDEDFPRLTSCFVLLHH